MREDMDKLFGSFWEAPTFAPWAAERISPTVDVFEKDNNIVLKVDVPGLSKEDVEVTATEDSVSLRGEFKREEEVKEEGYYRHERRAGKFYRTIPMPAAIRADGVKANFKNGILEITAPRTEEARPRERKVPIEA